MENTKREPPKFKIGDLVLDTLIINDEMIQGEYAIGDIVDIITPVNNEISGYYYVIEWSDDEGSGECFEEKVVQEYVDLYNEYKKKCENELCQTI